MEVPCGTTKVVLFYVRPPTSGNTRFLCLLICLWLSVWSPSFRVLTQDSTESMSSEDFSDTSTPESEFLEVPFSSRNRSKWRFFLSTLPESSRRVSLTPVFIYLFIIYLFTITATTRIEDYQPVWSAKKKKKNNNKSNNRNKKKT